MEKNEDCRWYSSFFSRGGRKIDLCRQQPYRILNSCEGCLEYSKKEMSLKMIVEIPETEWKLGDIYILLREGIKYAKIDNKGGEEYVARLLLQEALKKTEEWYLAEQKKRIGQYPSVTVSACSIGCES